MSGTVASPGPYWLGTGPAEVEHLVAQAETYAAEAGDLLDRLGPLDGAAAIDVGCGALGILAQLRARVGPAGRVVGLDLEPRLLAVADRLAADRGLAIETVHADAAATGLPAASFDLVHARTLLINVRHRRRSSASWSAWRDRAASSRCRNPTPPRGCATRRTRRSSASARR